MSFEFRTTSNLKPLNNSFNNNSFNMPTPSYKKSLKVAHMMASLTVIAELYQAFLGNNDEGDKKDRNNKNCSPTGLIDDQDLVLQMHKKRIEEIIAQHSLEDAMERMKKDFSGIIPIDFFDEMKKIIDEKTVKMLAFSLQIDKEIYTDQTNDRRKVINFCADNTYPYIKSHFSKTSQEIKDLCGWNLFSSSLAIKNELDKILSSQNNLDEKSNESLKEYAFLMEQAILLEAWSHQVRVDLLENKTDSLKAFISIVTYILTTLPPNKKLLLLTPSKDHAMQVIFEKTAEDTYLVTLFDTSGYQKKSFLSINNISMLKNLSLFLREILTVNRNRCKNSQREFASFISQLENGKDEIKNSDADESWLQGYQGYNQKGPTCTGSLHYATLEWIFLRNFQAAPHWNKEFKKIKGKIFGNILDESLGKKNLNPQTHEILRTFHRWSLREVQWHQIDCEKANEKETAEWLTSAKSIVENDPELFKELSVIFDKSLSNLDLLENSHTVIAKSKEIHKVKLIGPKSCHSDQLESVWEPAHWQSLYKSAIKQSKLETEFLAKLFLISQNNSRR